jgi:hypothetical protein
MKKKKCQHCKTLFYPDPRNHTSQLYCCKTPECRKASKQNSQKRWSTKPENLDYFKGPHHCDRVREWRKNHPGYWRSKSLKNRLPLQDLLIAQTIDNKKNISELPNPALQDVINEQPIVLFGLIAHITGHALQDDMAITIRSLIQKGLDISHQPSIRKGERHDIQTPCFPRTGPYGTQTVQLAGSPTGP